MKQVSEERYNICNIETSIGRDIIFATMKEVLEESTTKQTIRNYLLNSLVTYP
jgi:hypothetical protein